MVMLYVIRSHYYLYLLYVMVVEHHIVLSIPFCCFGGLVTHKHNKVWDAFVDYASLVWAPVLRSQLSMIDLLVLMH